VLLELPSAANNESAQTKLALVSPGQSLPASLATMPAFSGRALREVV